MVELPAAVIAAVLTDVQRDIVLAGPSNFAEADAIPEGLFEQDLSLNQEAGDESIFWVETELGGQVREVLNCQGSKR